MDPLIEYATRRDRWRSERQSLERLFIRIGNWRLALGVLEALLAWLVFGSGILTAWSLLLPLIAFIALASWHARVMRRRTAADRAIKFYESRLARVDGHWLGLGPTGDQFRSADHVYADDLDLFGKGSLFELASTCRLAAGEQTFASWLLAPASEEQVRARQEAARELSGRLELREEIALLGEDIRAELHVESLERWGSMAPVSFPPYSRVLAPALAIAGTTALIFALAERWPLWPFIAILVCDLLLGWLCRKQVAQVRSTLEAPVEALRLLSLLLAHLERQQFVSPHLQQLMESLKASGLHCLAARSRALCASKRIARLGRRLDWLDSSDHLLVRIIAPVLLWSEQLAMAVEAWRRATGPHIGRWVRAVAEFEALSSLAALTFERPQWSFPEFVSDGQPRFEAEGLQHPLLSPPTCVPNDLALNAEQQLFILSGSNMSGKSTLLRAIGLNAVLAWAGAPVAAKHLRISPLQPAASIRVSDSLQDNKSRFLAEILRLRQIVDLTKRDRPVLFLLDELLSGTNSHDRRIGAAGIVRKLVASNAIGLITTHDLALAQIEQDVVEQGMGKTARNVHFEDHMADGRIEFDYQLRPGVVTRSNALELMRAVGLEV